MAENEVSNQIKRKFHVSRKTLLFTFFIFVCFSAVINLMCFTGVCDVSDSPNPIWSSFEDVVLEANKMSINDDDINISEIPFDFPITTTDSKKLKLDVAKRLKSLHLFSLDFCPKESIFTSKTTLLAGRRETLPTTRFLTVGIPSITRNSKSYLQKTLASIFNAVNKKEENNVTVVVFLGDSDSAAKQNQLEEIKLAFKEYIIKGMFQVIQAPVDFYEPLRDLHRNLGDEMNRVKWRSKQALDYAFLMCYSSSLSKYYLQLEDDVIASPSFVSKIIDFVSSHKDKWFTLNVASLGYIGKLYPQSEVQNIASYIRLFYNDMPVDWLEPRWREYKGLDVSKNEYRSAALFQHIGLFSSFRPKESQRPNTLKEHYFDQFDQKYHGLNPQAEIYSDLVSRSGQASDAYTKGDKYFWSHCASGGNKVYHVLLKKAVKVKRIVVESGANFARRDFIQKATLEVGQNVHTSHPKKCSNYASLGEFRFGRIDVTTHNQLVIKCVRINIRYQGKWMVIREVNIWPT